MVFPVVKDRCESWTIKKAEHWRIDAFKLCCWRRPFRVPWTARRSNQSILKEIFIGRTDAEAEFLILWPPDAKNWLIGKDPNAGKDWRQEEKGTTEDETVGWHHCYEHEFEQTLEEWRAEKPDVLQSIGSQKIQTYWVTEQLKSTLGIPWSWENFGCWRQRLCP